MSEIQDRINSGEILGKELILDLYNCDTSKFSKDSLATFLKDLCISIDMTATEQFCWEYLDDPDRDPESMYHLAGYSFVQFLMTSNITLHSFDNLKKLSLNIYSCKDYDEKVAEEYCRNYFNAEVKQAVTVLRF